ncbi:dihydrofolate reductase [Aestuariivirga sp.]|uniref:dihydrofolate reductase n=1 Tax=Aestuariivirga sp. TaxID=2650926 RepID=UPI00359408C4
MDNRPLLSLVVARSRNGVIGCDNRLPWNVPSDLKRFKEVTMGHPIVMGRNTFESIGRPLPGRTNIVVSRDPIHLRSTVKNGIEVFDNLEDALFRAEHVCMASGVSEVMVVGGGEVFNSLLPRADKIYLTEIDVFIDDPAAIYFDVDLSGWAETYKLSGRGANDEYSSSYLILERTSKTRFEGVGLIGSIAAE